MLLGGCRSDGAEAAEVEGVHFGGRSCRSDAFFSEGKVAAMRPQGQALPVTAARANSRLQGLVIL